MLLLLLSPRAAEAQAPSLHAAQGILPWPRQMQSPAFLAWHAPCQPVHEPSRNTHRWCGGPHEKP
eukprot:7802635-Heterocapsa_arctica.AAC.1